MWVALIILLAFMVVILRTKPAVADVTITAIRYTLDDVTWIGLDGATLEPGYFKVAVTWKNNSSETVNTLMTLVVENQGQEPDQESVTVAPNEEVTAALVMEFMEGERRVTATVYNEETMSVLDTKTVNVSVVPPPPVCTTGETKCVGYNLYECQLVDPLTSDWVLKETNSEACGYVPPEPPVCAIGETKCEGFDLYECKVVNEEAAWVLTEANSTDCGYVPPPPPVCTLGETKCVGYNLYECQLVDPLTLDWVLIKENSETCGYVPPAECTGREQKCVGYDLYICLGGRWNLFTKNSKLCGYVPPEPPPVCIIGETKCVGLDLYECQLVDPLTLDWVLVKQNSEACGYVPPPVCTEGEFKCVGLDRHRCQNNQWVLFERNSLACGYVPPTPLPLDYLLMSKSELYNSLINGNVAASWWGMDYAYRRELGLKIVQWWSYDYFDRSAIGHAYGGANCTDPPTHNPYLEPEKNIGKRAGIGMETASAYRHVLFSNIPAAKVPNNVFWWKTHHGTEIDSHEEEHSVWKCYEPGVRFGLPMGIALGATDWLNSLQVAKDVSKLESWIFFQTRLIDGYPGCDDFFWPWDKYGREVTIWTIDSISSSGNTKVGNKIATISW